jgi:predicted ferric reductase
MTTQTRSSTSSTYIYIFLGMLAGAVFTVAAIKIWQSTTLMPIENLPLILGSLLPDSIYNLLAAQAARMGLPLANDTQAYWYMARAGGVVAYLLLWLATIWGIVMSSRLTKGRMAPLTVFGLHETLPLLATMFAAFHALVLLGDSYINFNIIHILIPFTSPYKPVWTGLGTIALLLSAALVVSFYVRKQIGQRIWRLFHFSAYLAFVLALVHGVTAGTDSSLPGIQVMYVFSGTSVLFLTYYRLLTHRPNTGAKASKSGKK